jgi:hypothetical protein
MNRIQIVLRVLVAMFLVAFALPIQAQNSTKFFYAEFKGVSLLTGTVDVTFYNATPPPGVSTVNSLRIDILLPQSSVSITNVKMIDATTGAVLASPSFALQLTPDPPNPQAAKAYEIWNFPGFKNGKSATFRLTLGGLPTTCSSISWAAFANTGNSYPGGDEFQPTRTDLLTSGVGCTETGTLNCDSNNSFGDPAFGAAGNRGGNKDGSACVAGNYTFLNDIPGSNTVYFQWDQSSQQTAAFSYFATFNPEFVNAAGASTTVAMAAWERIVPTDPNSPPRFEKARACTSDTLPGVIGTLPSAITSSQTTINVSANPAIVPPLPFAILVQSQSSNEPERMKVTAINGSVWTVVRGDGQTTPVPHAVGSNVNTTPLPIVNDPTSFYLGKPAQVCVWKEVVESVGAGPCLFDSAKFCAKVQKTIQAFDLVDGWLAIK